MRASCCSEDVSGGERCNVASGLDGRDLMCLGDGDMWSQRQRGLLLACARLLKVAHYLEL